MKNFKIELKKVSTFNGHDGMGFNADVFLNGVNCLHVHDGAYGGCFDYHLNIKNGNDSHNNKIKKIVAEFDKYIELLPEIEVESVLTNGKSFKLKPDRDYLIENKLQEYLFNKQLNTYQKKSIVVGKPNSTKFEYYNLKKPLTSFNKKQLCSFINTKVKKECDENGYVILNTNLSECGITISGDMVKGNWFAEFTEIRFCKKGKDKLKSFWVEDYNEQEKQFFLDLGFTEKKVSKQEKEFGLKSTLNYSGKGLFGAMDTNEWKTISSAVMDYFKLKKIPIYEYQLHELL